MTEDQWAEFRVLIRKVQAILIVLFGFCILSAVCALSLRSWDEAQLRDQLERIQAENKRLNRENDARWRENMDSMKDRQHINGTLSRLDQRSEYLDTVVRQLQEAERKRREAREKREAAKK